MKNLFLSLVALVLLTSISHAAVVNLNKDITENGMDQGDVVKFLGNVRDTLNEVVDDHGTSVTFEAEIDTDHDKTNDYLYFLNDRDGVIGGDHTFTAGAAVTLTGAGRVTYRIGGQTYTANVDTTITLEDNGDVTQSKYGSWRVLIDKSGVVTTQDPAGSGAMAFDAAEDAVLSLSQRAITASTVEIGYLTLIDTDSVHNIGTNNLNASGVTTVTYIVTGPRLNSGLTAALGSTFTADDAVKTVDVGTIDARVEAGTSVVFSRNLAQISAITNQAMDDADTVATTKYGGWLMVSDLAGTGIYALGSDGIAGAVSAMTHATAALRNTALDNVQDRLPALFAPLGRILLFNTTGGNSWVAVTDDWNHDTAVATVTNYTFAEFGQATLVGDVGRGAPTAPVALTASPAGALSDSTDLTLSAP